MFSISTMFHLLFFTIGGPGNLIGPCYCHEKILIGDQMHSDAFLIFSSDKTVRSFRKFCAQMLTLSNVGKNSKKIIYKIECTLNLITKREGGFSITIDSLSKSC